MWSFIWNEGVLNPMINLLLVLYNFLGNNFLIALIVFTAAIRLAMLPLTLRQQKSMMKTQEMQPQVQAIQKKFKDDPQRMQEEFAKIGYNPLQTITGCLPLLLQMPIFFGLYRAILFLMASTPQGLYNLSERAYDWVNLTELLPVSNSALWLNLGQADPLFILPVLVGATMYLSQKLTTTAKKDDTAQKKDGGDAADTAAAMQKQMMVTMPLMFGFMSMQFPSGLSIYFIVSNLISILQGFIVRRNKANLQATQDGQNGQSLTKRPERSTKSEPKSSANSKQQPKKAQTKSSRQSSSKSRGANSGRSSNKKKKRRASR